MINYRSDPRPRLDLVSKKLIKNPEKLIDTEQKVCEKEGKRNPLFFLFFFRRIFIFWKIGF